MALQVETFRMPRYREIPDVGLYLEQVTKYINGYLMPLGVGELTASMVSNYVKKGYISNPVRKQYNAEQIAYLFFISVAKKALSIENIGRLFAIQKQIRTTDRAYDYFCQELEKVLCYIYGVIPQIDELDESLPEEARILRSTIIAVANIIYLNDQLAQKG